MIKNNLDFNRKTRLMDIGVMSQSTVQGAKDYVAIPSNPVSVAIRLNEELKKSLPKFKAFSKEGPKKVKKRYGKDEKYIDVKGQDLMTMNDLDWDLIYQELKAD